MHPKHLNWYSSSVSLSENCYLIKPIFFNYVFIGRWENSLQSMYDLLCKSWKIVLGFFLILPYQFLFFITDDFILFEFNASVSLG